jgi:hypothetical protein
MPTLARAKIVQQHMGGDIYWDLTYECYRVMSQFSPSLQKWPYRLIEG